jgi:DNA repair exonuclease SbcCD ATPase subunit
MKITRFILENFSNIDTAMNARRIEIDFRDVKNKIILLIGPNGSGKTSLLSLLTPFATVGGLDIRNSANLILEGKNGYKEIEIINKNDIYIIKHFYTAKKPEGHSVKSYIMKNGVELNANGNVSSFKEYVKDELNVEMDYLKLIRLGSNVTSMIDLSETERKTFMNKLLSDADIFLTFFKKVNNDLKQLKEMISHAIDKQNRLGVVSIDDIENTIDNYEKQLLIKKQIYDEITSNISVAQHAIDSIEESYTLKTRLTEIQKKLIKMRDILDKKDYESSDPEFYSSKIVELDRDNIKRQTQNESSLVLIKSYLNRLDELSDSLHQLEVQYIKEQESDKEIISMEKEIEKLTFDIENIKKSLTVNKPDISKSELDAFIVFLKNTQMQLNRTYEFGKEPVKNVVKLMKNRKNVMSYINSQLLSLDSSENSDIFLERLKSRFGGFVDTDIPNNCVDTNCKARQLYIQIANLLNSKETEKTTNQSLLQSMELVYKNLSNILIEFADYSETIQKLPDHIKKGFLMSTIYDKISDCEYIYDEKILGEFLSIVTEYDNIQIMEEKKESLEILLSKFKKFSNLSYIKSQIDIITEDIEDYNEKISENRYIISRNKEVIDNNNRTIEIYNDLKETFTKHDELEEHVKILEKEWDTYINNTKYIKDMIIQLNKVKTEIGFITEKIQKYKTTLTQYKDLQKDLISYNKIYDEMTLIKESLSSSKGIPLRYIKNYLGNTEEITNELLDIAYNGDIYIDKFKITQNEFTIPFYNKGKILRDVKLASQGETSFISIALAFALSSQTMSDYNIMLLDEIDSTLDIKFKEKFLKILENQIDRINAEQCFFITHGNMFSSYPVDVLSLGDNDLYKGTIKIKKL